jgi:hypothetical protein
MQVFPRSRYDIRTHRIEAGGMMAQQIPKGTREYYNEQINYARLLQEWGASPQSEQIRLALFESMEKLGLIQPIAVYEEPKS